ncbi:MAG: hypothetical protein PWQ59_167 [Thermoanaerobacterium sp.]|jgi:hypothetical protein|nr:hypothetical protein [Thermoanaerobacterium sp.]
MDGFKVSNVTFEVPLTNNDYIKVNVDFYTDHIYSNEYLCKVFDSISNKLKIICDA